MTDDARPDELDDAPDARDQALLDTLADALGARLHTDGDTALTRRCEGLISWLGVDAELAELADSAALELAGTRGGDGAAALEFSVSDGTCVIELQVVDGAVLGQILGVVPDQVTLRVVTGVALRATVDALGAFSIEAAPPGSARIEIENSDGRRIHTDWFVL